MSTGVLQLLFDANDCPATSTDVTALLYTGEESTSAGSMGQAGGVSGQSVRFTKSTNQRWSCTFTLIDTSGTAANLPAIGQAFRLLEDGTVRFSGYIDQVEASAFEGSTTVLYFCTCSSWASLFDHRVITKVYQQNQPIVNVILDIIANLGEGITTHNVVVSGSLTAPIALDGPTIVSAAFDTIKNMVDGQWWVDENKDLHFVANNAGPTLGWSIDQTGAEFQAGSMVVTRSAKDYRNVQYVSSTSLGQPPPTTISSNPIPAPSASPAYTLLTDTFVTATAYDFFVLTSQPIQLDPSNPIPPTVKVNGVAQTVKEYFANPFGANAWYWTKNSIGVQQGQQIAPTAGSTVEITYQAFAGGGGNVAVSAGGGSNAPGVSVAVKNWVVQSNPSQIAARAAIEGHSGKWEQVSSVPGVSDATVANALASGILTRADVIPTVVKFDTWRSGYVVGGKLTVNIPYYGINATFTVQQIDAVEIPNVNGPISGQTFIYTITLSDQINIGDYIKWMEGLVKTLGNGAISNGSGVAASTTASAPGLQFIREIPIGTKNGSNKIFTLSFNPQPPFAVWLYVNGVLQHELGTIPDYSLSGNTITFTTAPKTDDEFTCIYMIANAGLAPQKVNVTLYSTGAYGSDGLPDPHWVKADGVTPAIVINTAALPPAWVAAPAGSRWIGDGSTGTAPPGTYKYKLFFQFPSTTGLITGFVTGDDDFALKLNGATILSGGFSSWTSLHAFSTSGPFVAGVNTLEVDVNEDGMGGHGVLVVITQATSP